MSKFLMAASAAALLAGAALAADSGQTQVFANVTPTCDIISQEPSIDLTSVAPNTWSPDADFSYSCNFIGSPTLTFVSANGGLVNPSNGATDVDYGIYLNDTDNGQSPAASLLASNATGAGVPYSNITQTVAANAAVQTIFKVGPLAAFDVAGTYSDTLTISIAP